MNKLAGRMYKESSATVYSKRVAASSDGGVEDMVSASRKRARTEVERRSESAQEVVIENGTVHDPSPVFKIWDKSLKPKKLMLAKKEWEVVADLQFQREEMKLIQEKAKEGNGRL